MIDLIIEQTTVSGTVTCILQVESSTSLVQKYSPFGGYFLHRFMNGAGFKQRNWKKLKTTITGNGHVVDAIDGLDWDLPMDIHCIGERSLESVSNVIALPVYREDAPVTGFAVVAGRLVEKPVTVLAGVATVATEVGATRYKVVYFPILTVFADEPSRDANYHDADFSFTLEAEEA